MKKLKAFVGLAIGLAMGFIIGFVASEVSEIKAEEPVQIEVKEAVTIEATKSDENQLETPNKAVVSKTTDVVEQVKQDEPIQNVEIANATVETTVVKDTKTTQYKINRTEKIAQINEVDEIHGERTEGELIGTILAFEVYEEAGATDILVEFENGETFNFTDWYAPKLVVGEKRLIHFISFDYGDEGTETYYYILDNGVSTEKTYESVETVYSSAIIQSIDLNEKEFVLAVADGTNALANFFAPEDKFEQLGLIEGASVDVVIYNSFHASGELAKKEVYFNFANEANTMDEATTDTTMDEALTDTVNITDEAMTDTVNTTDSTTAGEANIMDETITSE